MILPARQEPMGWRISLSKSLRNKTEPATVNGRSSRQRPRDSAADVLLLLLQPERAIRWRRRDSREMLSWYVIDDRKLYRPGEEVNIKGWIRKIDLTPTGGTEMFTAAGETVNYVLKDSQNNEITKGSVKLNALAGFNFKFKLPPTMNLGGATVAFELEEDGGEYSHYFQVQEFRRPEFEITARASEAPHFVGSFATATMTAAYYSGGGLADTEVDWTVTSRPTNYTPPNRDDYTFGKFYAWWRNDDQNERNKSAIVQRPHRRGGQTHAEDGFRRREPATPIERHSPGARAGRESSDARGNDYAAGPPG